MDGRTKHLCAGSLAEARNSMRCANAHFPTGRPDLEAHGGEKKMVQTGRFRNHCPGRPRIWRSLRMTARPPGLPAAPHPSQDRHGGCSTLGDSPNGNAGPGAPVTTQHCREPYCLGICGEWHLDFSILCEYCKGIQLLWALLQTSNHSSSQSVNQVNIVFSSTRRLGLQYFTKFRELSR